MDRLNCMHVVIVQDIYDLIAELDDFVNVGWIGVNMKPAKHLVCALISKWIHTYTSFLTKQVAYDTKFWQKILDELMLIHLNMYSCPSLATK